MNCFIISLFFVTATSLDLTNLKPHIFSQVLSRTTPEETQGVHDDVATLIATGEDERAVALHNLSVATDIWTVAFNNWQKAYDEEQVALGIQKDAEDAEAAATVARDNAIAFKNQRIAEKQHADSLVPPAKQFMEDEIKRVDEERATLEKVQGILEGIKGGNAAIEINSGRKLLSRTARLLSNHVFLAALKKADPTAVQQVIDLVVGLIDAGEDDRNFAIGEYNDRVSEAEVAAANLVDAEAALASRETELVDATAVRVEKTKIAEGKTAVEVEKRAVRDAKKEKLDAQTEFTNREIARINAERHIYDTSLTMLETLKKIIELLE